MEFGNKLSPHALPQVLDLTQAQPLRDVMAALLREGDVVLDAAQVERLSTPCAQVLWATGKAAGSRFAIHNASAAFQTALADLGLSSAFGEWMAFDA